MVGWMKGFLTEGAKFVLGVVPQTQNGAAVNTLYSKMTMYKRFLYIVMVGDRAGATTPNVTLTQATDSSGTGAKTLSFDYAWGVDAIAQTADKDTLAALTVASDAVALSANDNSLLLINVRADQMDINNGFNWHKLTVATPGANNVPIAVLGIAYDGNWSGKETTLPSVLG